MKTNNAFSYIVYIVVGIFFLWRFFLITTLPPEDLVTLTADDSFYYMNIASNIAAGNGVTFDGINKTNGFHPLWQMILVPIFFISPDRLLSLRIILIFQIVLYYSTIFIVINFFKSRFGFAATLPSVVVFLFSPYSNRFIEGMETPIQLALLLLILIYIIKKWAGSPPSVGKDLILGSMIGMLVLARIDSILLLVSCIGFFLWLNYSNRFAICKFFKRSATIVLPIVLLVSPFAIWNKIHFNHFSTISSTLKSSFPSISFDPMIIARFPQWSFLAVISFLLLVVVCVGGRIGFIRPLFERMSFPYRSACFLYSSYVLIYFCFVLLFSKWELTGWYFGFFILSVPLFFAPIISVFEERIKLSKFRASLACVFFCMIGLGLALDIYMQNFSVGYRLKGHANEFYRPSYLAAIWAKENTPPSAVFATTDCGVFGYFSERSVIELDGLVNNFEYQNWLLERGLRDYLINKGVNYVRDYASEAPKDYTSYSYWIRSKSDLDFYDNVDFAAKDEVYRSDIFKHLGKDKHQIIWRF